MNDELNASKQCMLSAVKPNSLPGKWLFFSTKQRQYVEKRAQFWSPQ